MTQNYNRCQFIDVKKEEDVATLLLNKPEHLNAIDEEMHKTLEELFVELDKDPEVGAIVITGAGHAFCSGGAIDVMEERHRDHRKMMSTSPLRAPRHLLRNLLEVEAPIIAAVNGDAIGLGASIALLCDTIFAAETARFGDPHVRIGLSAGDGSAVVWTMLCGAARAKQYLMTGDLVEAQEAERIGLVNSVVPEGQAYEEALKFAKRLTSGNIQAIKWTKYTVNKLIKDQMNLVLDTALALEWLTFHTEEHKDAVKSFLKKRQAKRGKKRG